MRARVLFGVVAATAGILLSTGDARADAGDASDVGALAKQLNEEHSALSTSDCNAACRALGSIRRAADKICALEPGPRCDVARTKAADATRRVRDACPDCVIASSPPAPLPNEPERAMTQGETSTVDKAPASEARGGCRSCSATDSSGPRADLGMIVLAAFGLSRVLQGRRKKDRPRV
jgi:hypothetical protein